MLYSNLKDITSVVELNYIAEYRLNANESNILIDTSVTKEGYAIIGTTYFNTGNWNVVPISLTIDEVRIRYMKIIR